MKLCDPDSIVSMLLLSLFGTESQIAHEYTCSQSFVDPFEWNLQLSVVVVAVEEEEEDDDDDGGLGYLQDSPPGHGIASRVGRPLCFPIIEAVAAAAVAAVATRCEFLS